MVAALVFHFGEWDSNRLEAQVAAEKTILVVEKRDDRMSRGEELTKHMSQSIDENLCCVTLFFIIFQSGSLKKSQFFKRRSDGIHLLVGRTVFENQRKSLIQHCERSELRLHFEWTKVD